MQEVRYDGVETDWEPLDYDKMRTRLESGEVAGFNVLKMALDEMSVKNNTIAAKRNKKKRERKARASRR